MVGRRNFRIRLFIHNNRLRSYEDTFLVLHNYDIHKIKNKVSPEHNHHSTEIVSGVEVTHIPDFSIGCWSA
jgi:hypothetical protein